MKTRRQQVILDVIRKERIETQEELAAKLIEAGYAVTQATVSRDIRELRLTKTPFADGRQYYTMPSATEVPHTEKYTRVLKDGYVSASIAGNLLVLRTVSGMAMAVAAALDALSWPEIVGSIAGDDTIFCAAQNPEQATAALTKMKKIVNE